MILLRIKIALQNDFKCLQEAGWAWLGWRHPCLCLHEASQVLRSEAESGRESWRATDLIQPGPVNVVAAQYWLSLARPVLFTLCNWAQLRMSGNMEKIVSRDKQWRHLLLGRQSSPSWRNCCKNYYILWRASFFLGNICHAYDYRKLIFTVSKLFVISWWLILVNSDRK